VHLGASAHCVARRRLLHLRYASGCLGTSHGTWCSLSLTSSPRAGSSSTTSPTPRVRVPRHVAWLVSQLVVDYFAYAARLVTWLVTRLVVDYFDYATRPGASARRVAHHATRRAARRRLLCLRRASGCLSTSRGSSRGLSSTTSTTPRVRVPRHVMRLVVDYFTYAGHPGASAHRTTHHAARR
jgi:hypothetical protein